MISVEGLRKSIRNGSRTVDILKGLDFTIPRGTVCGDHGGERQRQVDAAGTAGGAGYAERRECRLNGTEISYLPEDKLAQVRGKTIGFVFQSYQLIPTLTALENVLAAA